MTLWRQILAFLASLKLAVLVILGLAFACATATVLESLYDIPTARYWVYQAGWFRAILLALCVNLIGVMVDRWPWKLRHAPFLLAHIGIITLLFGSWLTEKKGLDGNLRITEGETTSVVEIEQPMLTVVEGERLRSFPVRWTPPEVSFKPISLQSEGLAYDLRIQDYITHADPIYEFLPKPAEARLASLEKSKPALKITVSGGPMRITQDFWLWTGDSSTQGFQAGPAWFELTDAADPSIQATQATQASAPATHGPRLTFRVEKNGSLSWHSVSSSKEVTEGRTLLSELKGKEIDPHWKGVKITLAEFVPDAWVNTTFKPSRVQHGEMAPPSAIRLVAGEGADSAGVWLGIGSRAMMRAGGHDIEVSYHQRRVMLPFAVRLDRFAVDRYQGTNNPAAYSSRVTVQDRQSGELNQLISMNEPLEHAGITLYQASYEDASPRPVTSILAVNQDPGRRLKYLGSLLIVFGSIWLFAVKYRRNRQNLKASSPMSGDAAVGVNV